MSFTNPAPIGGYNTGDLIDESEINYWCGILPDAIDGAGGGTYVLTAPLSLQGDVVSIDELTVGQLTGDLDVTGDITADDITGNTLNGTSLTLSGTLTANGNSAIGNSNSDTCTILAATSIQADFSFGNVIRTTSLLNALEYSGAGRVLMKATRISGASSIDITTDAQVIYCTGSSPYTLTLSDTFAKNGDWFTVYNNNSATVTLAGLSTLPVAAATGVTLCRISGTYLTVNQWTF